MRRWVWITLLVFTAAGCRQGHVQDSLWQQVSELSDETTRLALDVQRLQEENTALTAQIETLSAIDQNIRMSALVVPETLRIGRHCGLYDKSKGNGEPDTLVVYLKPTDAEQDTIKAAGRVQVQLWNLAAADNPKLKQWDISPEELKRLWGRGLFGAYYRLQLPLDGALEGDEKELNLRVQFTDYLTGRVLTDQRVITQ